MAARKSTRGHSGSTKKKDDDEDDDSGAAAGRALWNGSISFGLLQIPVALYTAERRNEEIHFHQLEKKSLSRIKYERVSAATGKPVAWKDIVKGYEYEPDNYVILEPEDLEKANVKATQTLDIQDFVPADQIEPSFFETPYYLIPQKRATKAYVLLRKALEKKGAVAIATFVMRTREHLVAIMPVGDALVAEILRFGHELKAPKDLPLPKGDEVTVHEKELAMAEQLIDGMMSDWTPAKYKDRYYADVMKMIEEKAKTGTFEPKAEKATGEVATDVVDLLALLQKSVAANDAGGSRSAKSAAKSPAKKKTAKRAKSPRRKAA
ncbi:MAG: Ku domain protein [Labilithrix sp.]|nr:Ku domain protein [Labilithrix sp.]